MKAEEDYTEDKASTSFERDFIKLSKQLDKKNILLIFDEIEHITHSIALFKNWREGNDFM